MFGKWHLDFQYEISPGAETLKAQKNVWNQGIPAARI